MAELVMAVDPGIDTGVARGLRNGDGTLEVQFHGWMPWKQFLLALYNSVLDYDTLVYESWRLRAKEARSLIGSDLQSSQCIGGIKLIAWTRNIKLVTQEPSDKPTANRWIEAHGIVLPDSPVEHNRDALRHLYYYHYKNGGI